MKVLLVNGSPHAKGSTYTALKEIADTFEAEGVEADLYHIGAKPIAGCMGCGACTELKKCVIDDTVNEFVSRATEADGVIFGSPVYYASANGSLISFMDRAFFSAGRNGKDTFYLKPGACVVAARRAGTTAALDQMLKYLSNAQMIAIPSRYWCMVHGNSPKEVRKDLEGMQVMRMLARNMAWFLRIKQAGLNAGVPLPEQEARVMTNFIR